MFKVLDIHFMLMFSFVGWILQLMANEEYVDSTVYKTGLVAYKL